eukprot:4478679-Amphidinium_carterae.2
MREDINFFDKVCSSKLQFYDSAARYTNSGMTETVRCGYAGAVPHQSVLKLKRLLCGGLNRKAETRLSE